MQQYPTLTLRKNEERRLLSGHQWAFSNELKEVRKDIEPGSIVLLKREVDDRPFALAFYNPHSLIAARVLTRQTEQTIDAAFFQERLLASIERRTLLSTKRNAVRLVHGESDFLPGLIIDRFNDIVSFQIVSAGFEKIKQDIIQILLDVLKPSAIIEKNKSNLRKLEGLQQIEEIAYGTTTTTEIQDANGVTFTVDVLTGQKTGFFLDQMENRNRAGDFVRAGDKVLDLFSNEGGFALNMALAGASQVTAVDVSQPALQKLQANWERNGLQASLQTVAKDCFDFVQEATETYDVVVVDPPALAKSKKDLIQAKRAYAQLNAQSMRLVRPDGVMVSASCSHHMSRDLMLEMLQEASRKARRQITILEERGAGIDHPILLAMPETRYLKVFYLRIH